MASAGIGIEAVYVSASTYRLWLLAHNGSSVTATDTGISLFSGASYDMVLSSDAAGGISCRINGGDVGTPAGTGAPTVGGLAGATVEVLNGTDAVATNSYIGRNITYFNLS
jgi:hypothetical protein